MLDLVEEVPHLRHFGLEAFELLVDPLVFLQLVDGGPFAVQVGAEGEGERGILKGSGGSQ